MVWFLWSQGFLGTLLAFSLCFILALLIRNMALVDVLWGFAMGGLVWAYALLSIDAGDPLKRGVILTLATLASLRLGSYILGRFLKHHPAEDPRYAHMRTLWTKNTNLMFLGAYLLQGSLMGLLSFPLLLVLLNPNPVWQWFELLGLAVWGLAFVGEALADRQLAQFKTINTNPIAVCDTGLWRYSRHPNYFFQWLQWVAFALLALGHPLGIWAWFAPVLMLHFLLNVTGLAITEQKSLERKGEPYRLYMQCTSPFIPWPPKKEKSQ